MSIYLIKGSPNINSPSVCTYRLYWGQDEPSGSLDFSNLILSIHLKLGKLLDRNGALIECPSSDYCLTELNIGLE